MSPGKSESAGFYRRGLPNVPRQKDNPDDFKAFVKVATDMQMQMERLLAEKPELGITQREVDDKRREYVQKGKRHGIKTLEDEIEKSMREEVTTGIYDRPKLISHLSLALAYLELTTGVNEDYLDVPGNE